MHLPPPLLDDMPQFMPKMPLLPRRDINLIRLRVGERLHLPRFIRIVMNLHAVKGHAGIGFESLF